ncbi:MAG: hypothetical protein ACFFDH_10885 [Promethearchaeota archaeon]
MKILSAWLKSLDITWIPAHTATPEEKMFLINLINNICYFS